MIILTSFSFGQKIDYNNFDQKLFEKTIFKILNERRKSKGVEELVWSNVLYKEASNRNMNILLKTDILHHPDYGKIWDSTRVRLSLAKESDKIIGGKSLVGTFNSPSMTFYENIFRSKLVYDITYEDLANYAIDAWEKSFLHNATQYADFTDMNKPGLSSCKVGISKSGNIYIVFNFVRVYRI